MKRQPKNVSSSMGSFRKHPCFLHTNSIHRILLIILCSAFSKFAKIEEKLSFLLNLNCVYRKSQYSLNTNYKPLTYFLINFFMLISRKLVMKDCWARISMHSASCSGSIVRMFPDACRMSLKWAGMTAFCISLIVFSLSLASRNFSARSSLNQGNKIIEL